MCAVRSRVSLIAVLAVAVAGVATPPLLGDPAATSPATTEPAARPAYQRIRLLRERNRHDDLARSLAEAGKWQAAIDEAMKTVAIERDVLGEETADVAGSYSLLGTLYANLHDYEHAIRYKQRSLDVRRRVPGSPPWKIAQAAVELARIKRRASMTDDDRAAFDRIDQLDRAGGEALRAGRREEALRSAEEALKVRADFYGTDDVGYADGLEHLGSVQSRFGDTKDAVENFTAALAIRRRVLGSDHPATAEALSDLQGTFERMADQARFSGDAAGAAAALARSLELYRQMPGDQGELIASTRADLDYQQRVARLSPDDAARLRDAEGLCSEGIQLSDQRHCAEALEKLDAAITLHAGIIGKDDRVYANYLTNEASVLDEAGREPESLRLRREAADIYLHLLGPGARQAGVQLDILLGSLRRLAQDAVDTDDFDAALDYRRRALAAAVDDYGPDAPEVIDERRALDFTQRYASLTRAQRVEVAGARDLLRRSRLLENQQRTEEALAAARAAAKAVTETLGAEADEALDAADAQVRLLDRLGRRDEADAVVTATLAVRRRAFGEHHPVYLHALAAERGRAGARAEQQLDYAAARRIYDEELSALLAVPNAKYSPEVTRARLFIDYVDCYWSLPREQRDELLEADRLERAGADRLNEGAPRAGLPDAQRCAEIRLRILGPDDPEYARSLYHLGEVLLAKGSAAKAVPVLSQAADIRRRATDRDDPEYQQIMGTVRDAYAVLAHDAEARDDYAAACDAFAARNVACEGLDFSEAAEFDRSWDLKAARLWAGLSAAERKALRDAAAAESRLASPPQLDAAGVPLPPKPGDPDALIAATRARLALEEPVFGHRSPEVVGDLLALGQALQDARRPADAAPYFQDAVETALQFYPRGHRFLDQLQAARGANLHILLDDALDRDDAAAELRIRQEIVHADVANFGPDSELAREDRVRLEEARRRRSLSEADRKELAEADRLDDEGRRAAWVPQWGPAVADVTRAMEIRRRILGDSIGVANMLVGLAGFETGAGDDGAADRHWADGADMLDRLLGPTHPLATDTRDGYLLHTAEALQNKGDLDGAIRAMRSAVLLRQRQFGPNHWIVRTRRTQLDHLLALAALDPAGRDDVRRAEGLCRQADDLLGAGKPAEALAVGERALAQFRQTLGETDKAYVDYLTDLAVSLGLGGTETTRAAGLAAQAVDLNSRVYGPDSPRAAWAMTAQAGCSLSLGELDLGFGQLREAIDVWNPLANDPWLPGVNDDGLVACLRLLTAAIQVQVADLRRENRGANVAQAWAPYAAQFEQIRQYLRDRENDPDSPASRLMDLARSLAELDETRGDLEKAKASAETALRWAARWQGDASPAYASALDELGTIQRLNGDYDGALATFAKARDILDAKSVPEDPERVYNRSVIASVEQSLGQAEPAWRDFFAALNAQQADIRRALASANESTIGPVVASAGPALDKLLSLALAQGRTSGPSADEVLTWVLRRKGLALDAQLTANEVRRAGAKDPKLAGEIAAIEDLRHRRDELELNPPPGLSPRALAALKQDLSAELDRRSALVSDALSSVEVLPADPDAAGVRAKLPDGTALVEIVRFSRFDYAKTGAADGWDAPHYAAFVVHGGDAATRLIDLGPAAEIDALVKQVRDRTDEARRAFQSAGAKDLPAVRQAQEGSYRDAAARLYQKLFAESGLGKAVAGAKRIYLSPDGELNLIPFEALVDGDRYLIEDGYEFAYLSGGRDLLRTFAPLGHGSAIFADPNFDLGASKRGPKAQELVAALRSPVAAPSVVPATAAVAPDAVASAFDRGAESDELRGGVLRGQSWKWESLAGFKTEADAVRQRLADGLYGPVVAYERDDALEDVFKHLHGLRLIHIATHGFYAPRRDATGGGDVDGPLQAGTAFGAARGLARLNLAGNPLLRSGIVLAGANTLGEQSSGPGSDCDDGWLTAEEVSRIDLGGTELVVLSACQTGLGDVTPGQGVTGLRLAFQAAGVRSLLSSLFEVPDAETAQFMRDFYDGLGAGRGKLASEEAAKRNLIAALRKSNRSAHPYFWASFVLIGDPT